MNDRKQRTSADLKVGIRPETREKLVALVNRFRWTYAEAVDVLADFYIEQHDLKTPKARPKRRHSAAYPTGQRPVR